MKIKELGWNSDFEEKFSKFADKNLCAGRVIAQHKNDYVIYSESGLLHGKLSGKFRFEAKYKKDFPAVGDWVVSKQIEGSNDAVIYAVLPRKSAFARKLPISGGRKIKNGIIVGGNIEEQIVAANIDIAFIVSGLDENFNIQRLERYITLAYNSGANPVILLNKSDLCENLDSYIYQVMNISLGIKVYPISVKNNIGMEVFEQYLGPAQTIVFLGSSGVGKSTIINHLLGEERQKTNTISDANHKGRHTTTGAQLFVHTSGGLIIDTAGIRELQLWGEENVLEDSFLDIYELADSCRYADCRHETEPGCAVKSAIEQGLISTERLQSFKNQLGELKRLGINKRGYGYDMKKKLQQMKLK